MADIKIKQAAKKVAKMRHNLGKGRPKPKETSGEVKRIEGDIAFVRFDGSEIDTPVNISHACEVGERIRVKVGDDRHAWTMGNITSPPTDNKVANFARRVADRASDTAIQAEERAIEAEHNSESAMASAESAVGYSIEARRIAGNTNQYFWHKEQADPTIEDDETGAHITEVPQEEWEDPNSENYHSGGNLLARSNGIAIRDGLTEAAYFSTTARIGTERGNNVFVKNDGVYIRTGEEVNAKFTSNEASIYSGQDAQYYAKVSPKSFGVYSKQYVNGYGNSLDSPFQTGVIEENYTSWQEYMVDGSTTGYDEHGDPTHVCSPGDSYNRTVRFPIIEPSSLIGLLYFQAPENYMVFPSDEEYTNFNITYKWVRGKGFDEHPIVGTDVTISTDSSVVDVFGIKLLYRRGRAYPYTAIGHYPKISKDYVFLIGNGSAAQGNNVFTISQDGYIRSQNEEEQPTLYSAFELYNTNEPVTVKRFGNVCHIHGKVKPTSTIAGSNTQINMFQISYNYRPDHTIVTLCQGSGNAKWMCIVTTDGFVTFSRYHNSASNANSYNNCATSNWLPFDITYIVS